MIIDTSAILASPYDETGSERLAVAIEQARTRRMSAGTLIELFVGDDSSHTAIRPALDS